MATSQAAQIGASNSRYTGDVGLGGGTFGVARLDTKPIEDLARYTMLYNKAEYDQRQKDMEAAAREIADYTSYDITSGIPKDAKLLQQKYDELIEYARNNPNAINYRDKKAWAEFKAKRNDLENDLKMAKVRDTMHSLRVKEISDETNPDRKRLLQEALDNEVNATDIRTPIRHSQKYDVALPNIPTPTAQQFDVYFQGANEDQRREFKMFNLQRARAAGNAYALDLDSEIIDESTPEGKERAIARKGNFWINGAQSINQALRDPGYRVNGDPNAPLDETKLSGISKSIVDLAKRTNQYIDSTRNKIISGAFTDKFGKPITFGSGLLREEDYVPINYQDGISPDELAVMAQFAAWPGDSYETKTIETDNQIQQEQLANQRRGQDLENARFWANYNKSAREDIIGADSILREVSDAIKSGEVVKEGFSNTTYGTFFGNKERVGQTRIADPNLLQRFGNIDKDGNTTNVPDDVFFNPKNNKLSLVYYKRDEDGNILPDGQSKMVDREVPLLPTQWMGEIVKRKFPNKDIGGVNSLIDQVYNDYGRDLLNMVTNYGGGATKVIDKGSSESGSVGGGGRTPANTVRVQSKDGKVYNVPASDVDAVLKANPGSKRL